MTYLTLTPASRERLASQIKLTGTFKIELANRQGVVQTANVTIEQWATAIEAAVQTVHRNCRVTLGKRHPDNLTRLIRFILSEANGGHGDPIGLQEGEHELVSDIESTLRDALRTGRGTYQLPLEDLYIELQLRRSQYGYDGSLTLFDNDYRTDAVLRFRLPLDRYRAFNLLRDNACGFVQGSRIGQSFDNAAGL